MKVVEKTIHRLQAFLEKLLLTEICHKMCDANSPYIVDSRRNFGKEEGGGKWHNFYLYNFVNNDL